MKKIFTLVAAMALVASAAQAQRINNLTFMDGETAITPLSKVVAFKPGSTVETAGKMEVVFLPEQQLANLTVTAVLSNDAVLKEPMPTDYTTPQIVEVASTTEGAASSFYSINLISIKPISLPVEAYDFTKEEGWATSCAEITGENIKFGSGDRSFILAFKDAPKELKYSINVAAKTWDPENIFDVEGSTDGTVWTNIAKYDATNPMPVSTATPAEKVQSKELNSDIRFVRFIYSNRKAANVTVSTISVTKGQGSNISNNTAAQASAFVANGELNIVNANEVAKVEVFNVAGQNAMTQVRPANTINLSALSNGVYLVRLTTIDGNVATSKVIVK